MDIPVPETISNITDNTTHQQRQERKVRVCSREHIPLQIDNRERFKVRVQDSVDETNV
jgi:ribosome assembly protein YihI (activator of Der GTPase)